MTTTSRAPRAPRQPSTRHADLLPYFRAYAAWHDIPAAINAFRRGPEPLPPAKAANDNPDPNDESDAVELHNEFGRECRPSIAEIERAMSFDDAGYRAAVKSATGRSSIVIGGLEFAANFGQSAPVFTAGQIDGHSPVTRYSLLRYRTAGGTWSWPREDLTVMGGRAHSTVSRPVQRRTSPRLPPKKMTHEQRRTQLAAFGVAGDVSLAVARRNAGLAPVAANDNHVTAMPYRPSAPDLFMSGRVASTGKRGWEVSRDATDLAILAEDIRELVRLTPPGSIKTMRVLMRARVAADIGIAFGKTGKTAERHGKRLLAEAGRDVLSALASIGVRVLAA